MDKHFLAQDQFKAILAKEQAVNINVDIVGKVATNEFAKAKQAVVELWGKLDELEKMAHQKKRSDRLDLHIDYRNRCFSMMVSK